MAKAVVARTTSLGSPVCFPFGTRELVIVCPAEGSRREGRMPAALQTRVRGEGSDGGGAGMGAGCRRPCAIPSAGSANATQALLSRFSHG